jgi:hypothetical protein
LASRVWAVPLALVLADLKSQKSYVQSVADANPAEAEAIIQKAGMSIHGTGGRTAVEFSAKYGDVSGMAILLVKSAGGRVAYEWQMTVDQKTWLYLPTTVIAKNIIQGLTPATTYGFRYRVVSRAGLGEWSQTVSLLMI